MMEITCKIIRDLLPLYVEELASEDSAAAVEEHISSCKSCAKVLEELKQPAQVTQPPGGSLKKLSGELRRRRRITAAFGIFLTAALLLGLFTWLYQPEYLTAVEAIAGVTEADGLVTIEFTSAAGHFRATEELTDSETGKRALTIIACSRNWDMISGSRDVLSVDGKSRSPLILDADMDIWYASPDGAAEDVLLWGQKIHGGRISLPWLGMRFYFLMGLCGTVVCSVLWLGLRKKRTGRLCAAAAVFSASFAFAVWFSTGGSMLVYAPADRPVLFGIAAVLAALITGCVICGKLVYDIGKAES